jgi:hypothetical protein
VPSEQSAEEARIVALQLTEIDSLLDLVKVICNLNLTCCTYCVLASPMLLIAALAQDAPAEELVPALEMLFKIFSAILDKPTEPKVHCIHFPSLTAAPTYLLQT